MASYIQNEQPYVYCNTCGRKDYRLLEQVNANPASPVYAVTLCNAFNSAPSRYPNAPCQGIMTTSTQTLSQLDNQTYINERTTS